MLMMPFSVVALVASGIVIARRRARSQLREREAPTHSSLDTKGGGQAP
jgi:hypothetical protein